MKIEPGKFIAIFVEEAQGHLRAMEAALLAPDAGAVTLDALSDMFLALTRSRPVPRPSIRWR